MTRTPAHHLLYALAALALAFPVTGTADNVNDFISIVDDAADNLTFLELQNDGNPNVGLCQNEGDLQFYVADTCAGLSEMVLTQFGNLGVGTTSPQGFVHLVTNATQDLLLESAVGGDRFWLNNNGFNQLEFDSDTTDNILVLDSENGGAVGIGADAPTAPLHVIRSDDTFEMLLLEQNNTSVVQDRNMMQLDNNGGIRFQFDNTELGTQWRFQAATGGSDVFEIAKVGTGTIEMTVDAGGNLFTAGMVNPSSSRQVKKAIEPVALDTVLAKVAELPVAEWTYKRDAANIRHLGPMAEDFHAAFGLGADNKHIATQDLAGVTLAAVKALRQHSEQQRQTIRDQQGQLDAQQERIAELEQQNRQMQAGLADLAKLKSQVANLQARTQQGTAAALADSGR